MTPQQETTKAEDQVAAMRRNLYLAGLRFSFCQGASCEFLEELLYSSPQPINIVDIVEMLKHVEHKEGSVLDRVLKALEKYPFET